MAILVAGTVAFDSVRTPFGAAERILGGSAAHFAVAASYFAPVRLIAVVGEDFGDEHLVPFRERGVDLAGLKRQAGKTFFWSGVYHDNLNDRTTLETQLNVLADFDPVVPEAWRSTPVVFLANVDPDLQARVLDQVSRPALVAADTMNFWIEGKPESLRRLLSRVDLLLVNDGEIRQLTGRFNLVEAAEAARALGPSVVVVKRGEHGVLVFEGDAVFALPAFPLRRVVDPTGAGDAFAGGFLGAIAERIDRGERDWRRAAVLGSVLASYQVEAFSLDRIRRLGPEEIRDRFRAFQDLTRFGPLAD
ncbi:MAG TPA: PfkB family carbohydrate kinase [Candidatus Polarisedimenticolaceae bacterium]